MKNYFLKFACLLLCTGFLFSCSDDGDVYVTDVYMSDMNGAYVMNYGSPSGISQFDYNESIMTNGFYKLVNGAELSGKIEYACNYKGNTYILENAPDQIITLNDTLAQLKNGVSLENPRCCVGYGDYLYISCWGSTPDWSLMPNTYIAKYNINTMTVENTIPLPGAPEGVEIANGKLYAALNFKKNVAVIDLDDNSISYIETSAVCSYFVKDNNDNLYVSLISSYSNPSSDTGLGYINTNTDNLTIYPLANVSSNYSQIMSMNNDKSQIYVISASYDSEYKLVGGVFVFDTATKSFGSEPVINGISGADAIAVNPDNDDIYLTTSPSFTDPGFLNVYGKDGALKKTYAAGVSPNHVIFLN